MSPAMAFLVAIVGAGSSLIAAGAVGFGAFRKRASRGGSWGPWRRDLSAVRVAVAFLLSGRG